MKLALFTLALAVTLPSATRAEDMIQYSMEYDYAAEAAAFVMAEPEMTDEAMTYDPATWEMPVPEEEEPAILDETEFIQTCEMFAADVDEMERNGAEETMTTGALGSFARRLIPVLGRGVGTAIRPAAQALQGQTTPTEREQLIRMIGGAMAGYRHLIQMHSEPVIRAADKLTVTTERAAEAIRGSLGR